MGASAGAAEEPHAYRKYSPRCVICDTYLRRNLALAYMRPNSFNLFSRYALSRALAQRGFLAGAGFLPLGRQHLQSVLPHHPDKREQLCFHSALGRMQTFERLQEMSVLPRMRSLWSASRVCYKTELRSRKRSDHPASHPGTDDILRALG